MNFRILPAALALSAFAFAASAQTGGSMSGPTNHMAGQPTQGCTGTQNHMAGGAMSGDHMAAGDHIPAGRCQAGSHGGRRPHGGRRSHGGRSDGHMAAGDGHMAANNTDRLPGPEAAPYPTKASAGGEGGGLPG